MRSTRRAKEPSAAGSSSPARAQPETTTPTAAYDGGEPTWRPNEPDERERASEDGLDGWEGEMSLRAGKRGELDVSGSNSSPKRQPHPFYQTEPAPRPSRSC